MRRLARSATTWLVRELRVGFPFPKRWLLLLALFAFVLIAARPTAPGAAEPRAAAEPSAPAPPNIETPQPALPPRPEQEHSAKVYAVLEQACAQCHQTGRLTLPRPGGRIGNILALDEIARTDTLVLPGDPERSALYVTLLTRHISAPQVRETVGSQWPNFAQIEAVRDWIEQLPKPDDGVACGPGRPPAAPSDIRRAVAAELATIPLAEQTAVRIVSLAAEHATCASDREMALFRDAAAQALQLLSKRTSPASTTRFGPGGSLVRLSLTDLGWSAADWQRLTGAFPHRGVPALALDASAVAALGTPDALIAGAWLAAFALRDATGVDATAGTGPAPAMVDPPADPVEVPHSVSALADRWLRGGGIARLAAETGFDLPELRRRLASMTGNDLLAARRIGQRPVPRSDLDRLMRALLADGAKAAAGAVEAEVSQLTVWTDASEYRVGDTLSLHAVAPVACHLTLVGVDNRGVATVLFPNDFEPDNLLQPGVERQVPGEGVPYLFRLREPGREQVIALCAEGARSFAGMDPDYERQRFTVLGNWRSFLREQMTRLETAGRPAPEPAVSRNRRGREKEPRPQLPSFADPHARAVLGYVVR